MESAAEGWANEAARLQLAAYEAASAAHGAGRAIDLAKRGERWRPQDLEEDVEAMLAAEKACLRAGQRGAAGALLLTAQRAEGARPLARTNCVDVSLD